MTPSNDMGTGDGAKFFRFSDADKFHERRHVIFVRTAGVQVADVGEPFDFGGHVGELMKFFRRQQTVTGRAKTSQRGALKTGQCCDTSYTSYD